MSSDSPNWHLAAYAKLAGKKQADLVRDLGVTKNTAHKLWYGRQAMTQTQIADLAEWVGAEPFELFMPPSRASGLRSLRATALRIVEEAGVVDDL